MLHPSMLALALLLAMPSQPKKQFDTAPVIKVGSVWGFTLLDNLPFTVVKVTDDTVTTNTPLGEQVHNKETFLEFFTLLSNPTEQTAPTEQTVVAEETFGFAGALTALGEGKKVARKGWNGKGIFVARYFPNDNDFINQSFLYIDSTGLQSDNPDAPKNRTAWFPSQTDMSAKDWVLV